MNWLLRRLGDLDYFCVRIGYWIRPYDMKYDDRRWRWQTRGCNRDGALPNEIDTWLKLMQQGRDE